MSINTKKNLNKNISCITSTMHLKNWDLFQEIQNVLTIRNLLIYFAILLGVTRTSFIDYLYRRKGLRQNSTLISVQK